MTNFLSDLSIAANLETPPETLRFLWFLNKENLVIRAAIASNPNSPVEVLVNAAEFYPEFVAFNPALDFLLVEDPLLFTKFTTEGLANLLKINYFADKFGVIILKFIFDDGYDFNINLNKDEIIVLFFVYEPLNSIWNRYRKSIGHTPVTLKNLSFRNCEIAYVNLTNVMFNRVTFLNVNFRVVTFVGCEFTLVNFERCNLWGTMFENIKAIHKVKFTACDLQCANFKLCDLREVKYTRCFITSISWVECDLTKAIIDLCHSTSEVIIKQCNVSGLKLSGNALSAAYSPNTLNNFIECDQNVVFVVHETETFFKKYLLKSIEKK